MFSRKNLLDAAEISGNEATALLPTEIYNVHHRFKPRNSNRFTRTTIMQSTSVCR